MQEIFNLFFFSADSEDYKGSAAPFFLLRKPSCVRWSCTRRCVFSHRVRANNLQKVQKISKNANAVENNLPVNEAARRLGPATTNNHSILWGFWFYIVCLLLKEDAGGDRRQNMGQSISKSRVCISNTVWGRIERSAVRNLWQKSFWNYFKSELCIFK